MQGFDELTDEAKEALKQSLGNKIIPQPDTMTTSAGPNAEEGPGRMPNESAAAHKFVLEGSSNEKKMLAALLPKTWTRRTLIPTRKFQR